MHKKRRRFNYNVLNNRLVIFLLTLYLVGIIFGFFLKQNPLPVNTEGIKHPLKTFFSIFCMHYWYIFVVWLMGLCIIGFIVDVIIAFFRGLIFGALLTILIKSNFKYFLIMFILDGILFIPIFIYLLYVSISLSLSNFLNTFFNKRILLQYDMRNYLNSMLFITTVLAIYSIILTVI